MTQANPPELATPQLIDKALAPLLQELQGLTWLKSAFGRCEALPTDSSYRKYKPAVYIGRDKARKEYRELFPDGHLGNFCFFDVGGKQDLEGARGAEPVLSFTAGLVFWFDFRLVYPEDYLEKSLENVKAEVLAILKVSGVKLELTEIVDRVPEVYKGYDYTGLKSLYSQRPYGCFRINMDIIHYTGKDC